MTTPIEQPGRRLRAAPFVWLSAAMVLAGFVLRLVNKMAMPLYIDEAVYTAWAQDVLRGDPFIGLTHNKLLYPMVVALFNSAGPEGPFVTRYVALLAGLVSIAACIALGRALDGRTSGLLSGAIYAVLPAAVLHERMALTDPQVAALSLIALWLMIRLARRPRWPVAALLGLTLAGAYLTKISAAPIFILPFAAAILFARGRAARVRALALAALAVAVGAGLSHGVYALAASRGVVPIIHSVSPGDFILPRLGDPSVAKHLWRDVSDYATFLWDYVGPAALVFVALCALWIAAGRRRWALIFLLIPGIAFAAAPMLVKRYIVRLPPRYLLGTFGPLIVAAAISLRLGVDALYRRWPRAARWAGAAALALILVPYLSFAVLLIHDVRDAPLTSADRAIYVDEVSAGYGYEDTAIALLARWRAGDGEPITLITTKGIPVQVYAYLGPEIAQTVDLADGLNRDVLAHALAAGSDAYLIEDNRRPQLMDVPSDIQLLYVGSYYHRDTSLSLYHLERVTGDLARRVYDFRTPEDAELTADYAAAAGAIAAYPTPRTVLVYPPAHAEAVAGYVPGHVVPLGINVWPPTERAAQAALGEALNGAEDGDIDLIVVAAGKTDPDGVLWLAARHTLYQTDAVWAGSTRVGSYVGGPAEPELAAHGVTFERVIHLERAAIIDQHVEPGGVVRVALEWRTTEPIEDSFKVFAHIIGADGQLVAQSDFVPGEELLPTTAWEAGETVRDRFAVRLPADLPPGTYHVRVGLYRPSDGLRLRVTAGEPAGPDHAVLGTFTVGEPDERQEASLPGGAVVPAG
jgi:4-amino-4-deoxy-L-arabinose transferase-like glycosyltransferase